MSLPTGAAIAQTAKPKLAIYGAASCGGCDIALINLHEHLLDLAAAFEIVFWPTVMDGKYADLRALADGELAVALVSGGMRTAETVELAELLRRKSRILVALGSCAQEGCIPGLANLSSAEQILDAAFSTESTDNPHNLRPICEYNAPEGKLHLPAFEPTLRSLGQVVDPDYTIPGCPPESGMIWAALSALIGALDRADALPARGAVLGAGETTVCDECPRTREVKKIRRFVRYQQVTAFDPQICLLEQGLACAGPATRNGCGALCPQVAAPCIGCYGPAAGVTDAGARLLSAFASVIEADSAAEIESILDDLPDPAGTFYRFGLAGSLLRGARISWQETQETSEVRP